jgi:hypothetical protein
MYDTLINHQAFSQLGGTLLIVHHDYKFLIEYFKPYIIGDLILYRNKYMCVLNPYLITTFLHNIIRTMTREVEKERSRSIKFKPVSVNHSYNYLCYSSLPKSISLVVDSYKQDIRDMDESLYVELYLRTLDKNGDMYNDITITDTMSTK